MQLESPGVGVLRVQVHRAWGAGVRSGLRDAESWRGRGGLGASARVVWGCGVGARGAGLRGRGRRPPHLGSGSRIFLLARAAGVALLFSMAIR